MPDWPAPPGVRALSTLKAAAALVREDAGNRERLRRCCAGCRRPPALAAGRCMASDRGRPGCTAIAAANPRAADAARGGRGGHLAPGVVCAILTADCLPVLLASQRWLGGGCGTCRLARAGRAACWRACVRCAARTRDAGHRSCIAWLGPAISAAHFEVGDEVRAAFLATRRRLRRERSSRNARGRWQCDLYALARQRLARLGIQRCDRR